MHHYLAQCGHPRLTLLGGLGFGYKWNMGWMHDTLSYIGNNPIHRKYHHNKLTFGLLYAFSENFVLPLSDDEVVHGKGSILAKMLGDQWQKFANLRAYLRFMCGSSDVGNQGSVEGEAVPWHEHPYSVSLTLPPLVTLIFEHGEP